VVLFSLGGVWLFFKIAWLRTPLLSLDAIDALVKGERTDEAIIYCQKRIMVYPEETASYYMLGNLYEEKRKFKDAEKIYKKLKEAFPDDALPYFYLGRTYFSENHPAAALQELSLSETLSEKITDSEERKENLSQVWDLMAQIYQDDLEDYKKAADVSKKRIELEPENWDAHYDLGTAYAYLGWAPNAYKEFNLILEKNPGTDIARDAEDAINYVRQGKNPKKSGNVLF